MPLPSSFSRRAARLSPSLVAALLACGCGAEPEDTGAAGLRLRFPDHADAVLSAREAFVPAAGGFRLPATEPGATWRRAARPEIELPRDGSGVIRFRRAEGGEIRVRELGAAGEGALAERAVSYRRAGGTSFWTATDGGVEEWLLLEEGVARGDEVVAAWQVEGATLRPRGAAVELLDEESGAPVLRVTAPRAHAASGRALTPALRVRGARIELSVDAGGEAALVDPAWEPAARMNVVRWPGYTATLLLPSGKVLVAGGSGRFSGRAALASAELYDPANDAWSLVAPMRAERRNHTATRLQDGEVLVVGGAGEALATEGGGVEVAAADAVERYDPATNTWTPAASMAEARHWHSATLLPSGKVLVTGGLDGRRRLSSAELYDPSADTWTRAESMNVARVMHAAALLPSGEVLVVGGSWPDAAAGSSELYDPEADTWTLTGSTETLLDELPVAMEQLPSGEVLAVGRAGAERYDPTSGAWSPTSPMIKHHSVISATLLHSGKVLVVGESHNVDTSANRSAELYDPEADTWTVTPPTIGLYGDHTATRLLSGDVLLIGAFDDPERYSILGAECASDADCGLAACVDGFCCESRCADPCHTCAMPPFLGRCVLQPRGSDARGDCAREGCDGSCDGRGACSAVPKGGVCIPAHCSDETHSVAGALCPGDGASCAGPSSEAREVVDCAPYHCDRASGTCKDRCSSLQDCVPGYACGLSGHCVRPPPPAADPGCSVGSAVAAAGAARGGLGVVVLSLLAAARRRASASRGEPARRRGGS